MRRYGIWIGVLVGAAVLVMLLHCFVFSSCVIVSSDMGNTLLEGDRVFVNKWSYGLRTPLLSLCGYHRWAARQVAKGDVVVFNNPADIRRPIDERTVFVYRCLAVPGDTVAADNREIVIPKRGVPVTVDSLNSMLLCNMLRLHEHRQASVSKGVLFVEGRPMKSVIFTKDYYWMVSDRTANISDSHLFGLVPDDHLIGRATLIWFSKDSHKNWTQGYRWSRFFHLVK